MALGRKDVTVTRTNGGADIFRLAGLFGDDNLIRHQGARLVDWIRASRTYSELSAHRKSPSGRFASGRQNRGETPPSDPAPKRCRRSCLQHRRESLLFGSAVLSRFGGQDAPHRALSSLRFGHQEWLHPVLRSPWFPTVNSSLISRCG